MDRKGYRHALLVTNLLVEDTHSILEQANQLRIAWPDIELSLIHVITKIPTFYFQVPSIIDIQDKLYMDAKHKIAQLGHTLNIAEDHQWVMIGSLEKEVLLMADKLNVDLIITGDVEDDLLPPIFGGSVVNRLIHRARCNVLCLHEKQNPTLN
ncbi:MAG: universal stress protein [Legionellales bacterium]|nr:universal stress protein [Legionellales bacterium]